MIRLRDFDWVLLVIVLALIGIGLILLYSATYRLRFSQENNCFERQLNWFILGFIIMWLVTGLDYHGWSRISYILYVLGLLSLILVLVRGRVIMGSQRWLELGAWKSVGIQPSEFIKIILVMTMSRLGMKRGIDSWKYFSLGLGFLLIPLGFILKQPDLGTAILSFIVGLSLFFLMGVRFKKILMVVLIIGLSSPLIWLGLKDYQRDRIRIFLNPYHDPLGSGYNIIQSRLAIGGGQLWGKGWLAGTQTQLDFVPEHHTDFIFTVLGEEWGYAGVAAVLGLYVLLILRSFRIVSQARDRYGLFLACGLTLLLAFQTIINIGVAIGLFPVTGLPLPFLSYGGSSLFSSMIIIGIIQNINIKRRFFK